MIYFPARIPKSTDHFSTSGSAKKNLPKDDKVHLREPLHAFHLASPVSSAAITPCPFLLALQPVINKFWSLQPFGCNLNTPLGDVTVQEGDGIGMLP